MRKRNRSATIDSYSVWEVTREGRKKDERRKRTESEGRTNEERRREREREREREGEIRQVIL